MALVGSDPRKQEGVNENTATGQGEAKPPAFDYPAYPEEYQQACQSAKTREDSELCAAWTAAVAAEEATDLAEDANVIAEASAILTFVSILLVVIALFQTDRSLRMAKADRQSASARDVEQDARTDSAIAQATRSAEAMSKVANTLRVQSEIAAKTAAANERIADAQTRHSVVALRSYLSVSLASAAFFVDAKVFITRVNIFNSGRTAARNVKVRTASTILPAPIHEISTFSFPETQLKTEKAFIPPNVGRDSTEFFQTSLSPEEMFDVIRRGKSSLCIWGIIDYTDEFEQPRETRFGMSIYWVHDDAKQDWFWHVDYLPGVNHAT